MPARLHPPNQRLKAKTMPKTLKAPVALFSTLFGATAATFAIVASSLFSAL